MAGAIGLLAWLCLLAAPLLILLDRRARQDRPVVLGALLLSVGQLFLGISNAAGAWLCPGPRATPGAW
jgi:O-antigen ligase